MRDHDDGRGQRVHRRRAKLSCLRGVSTLTAFGLAVEIGDWHRFTGSTIGAYLGLVPTETFLGRGDASGRSPRPATPTPAGCWSKAAWHHRKTYRSPGRSCAPAGNMRPPRPGPAATKATSGCTNAGRSSPTARSGPVIANVAIARELAGWCWSLSRSLNYRSPIDVRPGHPRRRRSQRVERPAS